MRVIHVREIRETAKRLGREMNLRLPSDVLAALISSRRAEKSPRAAKILDTIIENAACARRLGAALCQDTGTAEAYVDIGCGTAICGGDVRLAVEKGVREAYKENGFRMSMVADPFERRNTRDNTPVAVNFSFSPGRRVKITLTAKGGGSENAASIKFFRPSDSWSEAEDFIVGTVVEKAPFACPPVIVGVAVGGSFSTAPLAAKKTFLRKIGSKNPSRVYAAREKSLLARINALGIGPMALGGSTTALGVFIEPLATHMATLPCAVAIQCHALRRATAVV